MADPKQFYGEAYNAVLNAAKRQGAPHPEILAHLGATQAAHETAWGRHAPANNFFGIKGGSGPAIRTHEVMGGRNLSVMDHFRGYSGLQGSADDYVKLMGSKPRYAGVYNAASVPDAINAQARSGYATDPLYGKKLASIHARGSGGAAMPAPVQMAGSPAPVDQSKSLAFKNQMPGAVQTAAATPQQMAQPKFDPGAKPATTLLEKLNPISSAQAAPQSATLPRINPKDPSGPLLPEAPKSAAPAVSAAPAQPSAPAPVQAAPASSEQTAAPKLDPNGYADSAARMREMTFNGYGDGNSFQDVAARMRGTGFNGYGPGITEQNDIRTAFGDNARLGDMLPETPYAVTMAGSQQYMGGAAPAPVMQLPPIDVGKIPQGPGNGYQPATPGYAPMTPDPTQYQPIQTPLSTGATDPKAFPEAPAVELPSTAPAETFTPTDTSPAMGDNMPTATGDAGGGGPDMSGIMDALANLGGGGGEGGGGGAAQSGGGGGGGMPAPIPDFPMIGGDINMGLANRGMQANAPAPALGALTQATPFSLKGLGQAGMQPQQAMPEGFAAAPIKRLFT